jgi:hypothetical protein
MMDERIVDAVADAIEATMFAPHELPLSADLHAKYCLTARAAIAAHEAALREAGFHIHRFHDWKICADPLLGPHPQGAMLSKCSRCGAYSTDLGIQVTSCGTLAAAPDQR